MIDILRRRLDLDGEPVGCRYDQHDRFPGIDDAADGVNGELVDEAVLRRHEVDAPKLIFRRHPALDQLGDLSAHLGDFLAHIGLPVLLDLDDLQLGLGNLAAR